MSTIPWINEEKIARKYKLLHHYTCIENLDPILESGGLLAKDYRETNDSKEMGTLDQKIYELCSPHAERHLIEYMDKMNLEFTQSFSSYLNIIKEDIGIFYKTTISSIPNKPHLICFCGHSKPHHRSNGLLTMWRSYGGKTGIALGFDTRKMIDSTEVLIRERKHWYMYFDEVGYGPDATQTIDRLNDFPELPELYTKTIIQTLAENPDFNKKYYGENLFKFFIINAAAKHEDFEDERETRLIIGESVDDKLNIDLRVNGRILFPCLDALKEVIIGPHPNQFELKKRVEETLRTRNLQEQVTVRNSRTPFRSA